MIDYISKNAPSIIAMIALIITLTIHYLKSRKVDDDKDNDILVDLSIGQGKIFTELKNINSTIVNIRKESAALFLHKEDCLKRRSSCDEKFLTKQDHDRLHIH